MAEPGFDHSLMRLFFDRLPADTHQVIYIDHRGNGRSNWRAGHLDYLAQWGDDVHDFCQALGVNRPAVFGLSFSGMMAMSYAARHRGHPRS